MPRHLLPLPARALKAVRLLLPALLALALVAACGSDGVNAFAITDGDDEDDITIDTIEVPEDEVDEQLEAVADSEEFVGFLEQSGSSVEGDGVAGLDPAYVAQFLTDRIVFALISDQVEQRGLDVTDEDRDAGEADLAGRLGNGDVEAGQDLLDAMPESYREFLVGAFADVAVLQADLEEAEPPSEEELRAFYEENQDQFEQACGAHILIATTDETGAPLPEGEAAGAEDEAQAVIEELEGGADFAELAREQSDDPGSGAQGGDLGCAPRGQYVPEFEEALFSAEPGEVVGPVETQFGFHVIRLDELRTLSFDEARPQIEQQLGPQTDAFSAFVQEVVQGADVVVAEKYGTWDEAAGAVVPPESEEDPSATTLPTIPPDATLPPADSLPEE